MVNKHGMCCLSHKIGMEITSLEGRGYKKALAGRAGTELLL